jgi:hypothetical protein
MDEREEVNSAIDQLIVGLIGVCAAETLVEMLLRAQRIQRWWRRRRTR